MYLLMCFGCNCLLRVDTPWVSVVILFAVSLLRYISEQCMQQRFIVLWKDEFWISIASGCYKIWSRNFIYSQHYFWCSEGFSNSLLLRCFCFYFFFCLVFSLFYLSLQSASAFFLSNSLSLTCSIIGVISLSLSHLNPFSSHITPFPYISFTCCHTPDTEDPVTADTCFLASPYLSIIHSGTLTSLLPKLRSLFFFSSLLCISPPIILSWLDSWAGHCWRCFLPHLTIFRLTSAIWQLCTELPKRYKYHTHAYSNTTSCVCIKCSLNYYHVFMQNIGRTSCV